MDHRDDVFEVTRCTCLNALYDVPKHRKTSELAYSAKWHFHYVLTGVPLINRFISVTSQSACLFVTHCDVNADLGVVLQAIAKYIIIPVTCSGFRD
jgi:hypothetical protein